MVNAHHGALAGEPGIIGILGSASSTAPKGGSASSTAAKGGSASSTAAKGAAATRTPFFGLIADGVHVHPASVKLAHQVCPLMTSEDL